jgi:hypothetical protein
MDAAFHARRRDVSELLRNDAALLLGSSEPDVAIVNRALAVYFAGDSDSTEPAIRLGAALLKLRRILHQWLKFPNPPSEPDGRTGLRCPDCGVRQARVNIARTENGVEVRLSCEIPREEAKREARGIASLIRSFGE